MAWEEGADHALGGARRSPDADQEPLPAAAVFRATLLKVPWAVLPFAFSSIVPVRLRHLIPLALVTALALSPLLPFPWSLGVAVGYAA